MAEVINRGMFIEALVEAFPSADMLARMTQLRLDLNLWTVASQGANLTLQATDLLNHYAARDQSVAVLLRGALEENGTNLSLRRLLAEAASAEAAAREFQVCLAALQQSVEAQAWLPEEMRAWRVREAAPTNRRVTALVLTGCVNEHLVEWVLRRRGGTCAILAGVAVSLFGVGGGPPDPQAQALAARDDALDLGLARAGGVATNIAWCDAERPRGAAVDDAVRAANEASPHAGGSPWRTDAPSRADDVGADLSWRVPATLVGCDHRLAVELLLRSVEDAERGRGPSSATVVGGPGSGKSRIRREATLQAAVKWPDLRTILVRGDVRYQAGGFGAVQRVLAQRIKDPLALIASPVTLAEGRGAAFNDSRQRRFDQLRDLLCLLASPSGLLLVVEDAHLLDPLTLEAIQRICRGDDAPPARIAVWSFLRPVEERARLVGWARRHIELSPLDNDEAHALFAELGGSAPTDEVRAAGGVPLTLVELALASRESGDHTPRARSPSLEALYGSQFDALAENMWLAVEAASVFGRRFDARGVATLLECAEDAALATVQAIARPRGRAVGASAETSRHFFLADAEGGSSSGFQFVSATCRDVAYGRIPPERKKALHARAAAWLRSVGVAAGGELAYHEERGDGGAEAARLHLELAKAAASDGASDATRRHAAKVRALATDPGQRFDALAAEDDALMLNAMHNDRLPILLEMETHARAIGEVAQMEVLCRRCHHARMTGNPSGARAFADRARALAGGGSAGEWDAFAAIKMALLYQDGGATDKLPELRLRLEQHLRGLVGRTPIAPRIHNALGYLDCETGNTKRALQEFELAAKGHLEAGDLARYCLVTVNEVYSCIRAGDLERAKQRLQGLASSARRVGNERTAAVAEHDDGLIRRIEGDLVGAAECFARAGKEATHLSHVRLVAAVAIDQAYVSLQREDAAAVSCGLADTAVLLADRAESPNLRSAALAVALRAHHAAGSSEVERLANDAQTRAVDAATLPAEYRAELWFALLATTHPEAAEQGARAALAAAAVEIGAGAGEEARACMHTLCRRYLAPKALREGVAPRGAEQAPATSPTG